MDINTDNCASQTIVLIIFFMILMCLCLISFLIIIYYVYTTSKETIIDTIYVPLPNDNNNISKDENCPPAFAESNLKCKSNMDWLQQNWNPSMASDIMIENTRCYAYKKAKSEKICP